MSFFGGGGGNGWPPPPFFNQAPPVPTSMPMQMPMQIPHPFFQALPPGMEHPPPGFPPGPGMPPPGIPQPDIAQQTFNQYIPTPVSAPEPQFSASYEPTPQHQLVSSVASDQTPSLAPESSLKFKSHKHVDKDRDRDLSSLIDKYSSKDRGRREQSPATYKHSSKERDRRVDPHSSHERHLSRRDSAKEKQYVRRSPSEEPVMDSRGRQRDRQKRVASRDSPEPKMTREKPKVDIDSLLQDERLRNVLFAGISKATAKLEKSLKDGKEAKEITKSGPSDGKAQLFPSASALGSEKPRSILKHKDKAANETQTLSALERTLQMLRGKGDSTSKASERSSTERRQSTKGALSQIATYDEGNDDNQPSEAYDEPRSSKTQSAKSSHPFWTVPSPLEASKKEKNSYDVKEKMFEEWRQSIGNKADPKPSSRESQKNVPSVSIKQKGSASSKMESKSVKEGDNQEELDSTVQNILQSIGFNFDLSKRMQELARKKKQKQEDISGIVNESGSFMADLKSSLLHSGADLDSIESLIREARASSQGSRHSSKAARSPSPEYRDRVIRSQSRYDEEEREVHRLRELSRLKHKDVDEWERESPERYVERRRVSPGIREGSISPVTPERQRSGLRLSERVRDEEKDEYYYPEKDPAESPPSVPLFSSRKMKEALSSGLLKSLRVENFRVMSEAGNDYEADDSFVSTRRVILPAKAIQDEYRDESPVRTVSRKRSASPIVAPLRKERKISPDLSPQPITTIQSERKKSPLRARSPTPEYRTRDRSRDRHRDKERSPRRHRSRSKSPNRARSPRRRSPRSRFPWDRSQSPARRRRSPSPDRKRRSPARRRLSPRREDRSRSRDRHHRRPRNSSRDRPKKDISKLPDHERKAELQKMLEKKEKAGTEEEITDKKTDKKSTEGPKKDEDKKSTARTKKVEGNKKAKTKNASVKGKSISVDSIVTAFEDLTAISVVMRAAIVTTVKTMTDEELSGVLDNLKARKKKVTGLKTELDGLKKVQNELMRKSQRSGLGNNDPQLKANNMTQLEIEKEIDRLSTADLKVDLASNLEQSIVDIQTKLLQTAGPMVSDPKDKVVPGKSEKAKQSNWKSVEVNDEVLPDVKDSSDDTKSTNKKSEEKSQASSTNKSKKNVFYEYVDSGNHWCSNCKIECNALDQYFNHLHGKRHLASIAKDSRPWDNFKEAGPSKGKVGQAQSRRVKGTEMLIPVVGFFCKVCEKLCHDFAEAEAHVKSDLHFDNFAAYTKNNSSYERNKLLEKNKVMSFGKKGKTEPKLPLPPQPLMDIKLEMKTIQSGNCDNTETVDMELDEDCEEKKPAPPPVTKKLVGKKTKKTKSLRVKEQAEAGEIDDDEESVSLKSKVKNTVVAERDDDTDVTVTVPKMTLKPTSVSEILSTLGETSNESSNQTNKTVKSLTKFLDLAKDDTKKSDALSEIPIPQSIDETNTPLPRMVPENIPLPCQEEATVKSLQEVEDEQRQLIEKQDKEEKLMMGIDVDDEEEKPLAPVKRPPPLRSLAVEKPKSLDSLFKKVSTKTVIPKSAIPAPQLTEQMELESQIQKAIEQKIQMEKQKLKEEKEKQRLKEEKEKQRQDEEEEKRARKLEEKRQSSSEEDSDTDEEESSDKSQFDMESNDTVQQQSKEKNSENNSTIDPKSNECEQKDVQKEESVSINLDNTAQKVLEENESQDEEEVALSDDLEITEDAEFITTEAVDEMDDNLTSDAKLLECDQNVRGSSTAESMDMNIDGAHRNSEELTAVSTDQSQAGEKSCYMEPEVRDSSEEADVSKSDNEKVCDDSNMEDASSHITSSPMVAEVKEKISSEAGIQEENDDQDSNHFNEGDETLVVKEVSDCREDTIPRTEDLDQTQSPSISNTDDLHTVVTDINEISKEETIGKSGTQDTDKIKNDVDETTIEVNVLGTETEPKDTYEDNISDIETVAEGQYIADLENSQSHVSTIPMETETNAVCIESISGEETQGAGQRSGDEDDSNNRISSSEENASKNEVNYESESDVSIKAGAAFDRPIIEARKIEQTTKPDADRPVNASKIVTKPAPAALTSLKKDQKTSKSPVRATKTPKVTKGNNPPSRKPAPGKKAVEDSDILSFLTSQTSKSVKITKAEKTTKKVTAPSPLVKKAAVSGSSKATVSKLIQKTPVISFDKMEDLKTPPKKHKDVLQEPAPDVEAHGSDDELNEEDEAEMAFFMKDFVVLSEVNEEKGNACSDQDSPKQKMLVEKSEELVKDDVIETKSSTTAASDVKPKTASIACEDSSVQNLNDNSDETNDKSDMTTCPSENIVGVSNEETTNTAAVLQEPDEKQQTQVETPRESNKKKTPNVRGRGRGRGKRGTARKTPNTHIISIPVDTELPDKQADGVTEDVEEEKPILPSENVTEPDPVPELCEEAVSPTMGRTRRSTRTAAAKSPAVKTRAARVTRSKVKEDVAEPEAEPKELKAEESECLVTGTDQEEAPRRSLRSNVPSGEDVEMPTLEPETTNDDSDATITDEVEDSESLDLAAKVDGGPTDTGLMLRQTGRMRDPPMSGVVSGDTEGAESMVLPMDVQETHSTADVQELESLPTAGLSLGLDDESEDMDFAMTGVEEKLDHPDSS